MTALAEICDIITELVPKRIGLGMTGSMEIQSNPDGHGIGSKSSESFSLC